MCIHMYMYVYMSNINSLYHFVAHSLTHTHTHPHTHTQGGGAKNLDLRSLTADLTRATLEIPFSIPSYFALIARALGILEGMCVCVCVCVCVNV